MTAGILCAIDMTPVAPHVVRLAAVLAAAKAVRVTLLHAVDRRDGEPKADECLERLEHLASPLRERGVGFSLEVVEGEPAPVILGRAAGATLVVMGTHGGHGVERLMLGSVAEEVLDHAPCPVATVRAFCREPIRRIVCGVDLVDEAPHTVAAAFARELGAELVLLHVSADVPEEGAHGLVPAAYRPALLDEARERLSSSLATFDRKGLGVREVVRGGRPDRQLLCFAAYESADLLVVGVHPHLFGSTAHHVVRGADCPVLTVRGTAA